MNTYTAITTFHIENLKKSPTCCQSKNPRCIDLILTTQKNFVKYSNVLDGGIPVHHGIIVSTLKSEFIKGNPKIRQDINSILKQTQIIGSMRISKI